MKTLAQIHSKNKNISHIEYGIISKDEIVQQSNVRVFNSDIYDEANVPSNNGLIDLRMGILDKGKCTVCNEDKKSCMGHYGYITLSNYLFPISFLKDIVSVLKCICKKCGNILLSEKDCEKYNGIIRKRELNFIAKKKTRKEIVALSVKVRQCRFCLSYNGNIKKVKALSMIYHKLTESKVVLKNFIQRFDHLSEELRTLTNDSIELLRPNDVHSLFQLVPRRHYKYLMLGPNTNLSDLVFKNLTVPPNCIRPSVLTNDSNMSREDDITAVLRTLLGDLKLPEIHNAYASLIKPNTAILKVKDNKKYIRGMFQRLAGKTGRFRSNLMGKRTNFTGRTVISPDPYLRIDQVSIPEFCALKLTFTEMVTPFNIDHMRKLVKNGPFVHPGAITYSKISENQRQYAMAHMKLVNTNLPWTNLRIKKIREEVAKSMSVGDLVERHIDNGDLVLFNRQPSLHRLSMQSFSVVVKKERTLSFNPCCCNPFNADFDGDEMNIHLPQTYEAKAECSVLMSSMKNISSPNRGEPLTAPLQDILTAAYLLTSKDAFYTHSEFFHLASQIFRDLDWKNKKIYFPKPAILKPFKLYTGKQLISLVISPYRKLSQQTRQYVPEARLNLVSENKVYKGGEDLAPDDSYVVIHNSELMLGQLDKALLGGGSKLSMFYRILRDVSDEASCRSMERLCKIALTDLKYKGFSIGIKDVCPNKNLQNLKQKLIKQIFKECEDFFRSYESNTLDCDPGCSIEETLESRISSKLSNVRDEGGKACKDELLSRNAPLIMAMCGSKGSYINISQMVFCVGQQIIANKRIPNVPGTDRTLLYCPKKCRNPMSKGFVANSFYSGLNPMEFVFHAMSGREGLIDTAVKTAETGYMQRRLIKILEDFTILNDSTVRNFGGQLYQYKYGCDGYDPAKLETTDSPCNFVHELYHALQDNSHNDTPFLDVRSAMNTLNDILRQYNSLEHLKDLLRENLEFHFKSCVGKRFGVSKSHLKMFVENCYRKFQLAVIEPGTAVGVICGQSIGEPATQMTLKTFHFAGVASMNITQGVPRMQEIINATTNIKTPIVSVCPVDDLSDTVAKQIQIQIQPVFFKDIITDSEVIYSSTGKMFIINLSMNKIQQLSITADNLWRALDKFKVATVTLDVVFKNNHRVYIRVISNDDYNCQMVLKVLEKIQVKGIPNVKRTVIQRNAANKHTVFMEGGDLRNALMIPGVDKVKTQSNNIIEIRNVLGIEAAKYAVINEFNAVMAAHSLSTDKRHVQLLADTMCNTGEVLGFQRTGMSKSKTSVLCLASFESTLDNLFEAAYHNQKDVINGVSDCIAFGKTIPLGTGLTTLLYDSNPQENSKICRKRKFIDLE